MKKISTQEEYEQNVRTLIHHDHLYYEKAEPEISDYDYDLLLKIVQEYEKKHPQHIDPNSPSLRISDPLTSGFVKKKHKNPMLSLANTYSEKEVQEFITRVQKLLGKEEIVFSVELKIDGVAVSILYEKGILTAAITRGSGKIGDDITLNMKTIRSLPLKLQGKTVPPFLEVRGEVYLPTSTFQEMNQEREENGLAPWANPRNAAAGSLKLLDSKEVRSRKLQLLCYGLGEVGNFSSQHAVHTSLRELGLPVCKEAHFAKCKNLEEIMVFSQKIQKMRSSLPFEIDGIVIKVDHLAYHERLGVTGKSPRSAVAYKFAPERAESKVQDITLQLGRTGVLTPVAELAPTPLSGSTISRATLHNQEEMERKDIRIGDSVWIEKGGDVIPKVVAVIREKRPPNTKPWQMPTLCPFCQKKLQQTPEEVAVRCLNSHCPEIELQRLIFYVSKQGMDIAYLGVRVMEKLYKAGLVRRFSDIYRLEKNDIDRLPNFKEKSVENLLQSIARSKSPSLSRFLLSLGIKYVGKQTALLLEEKIGSLETLFSMTTEELLQLDGVGEKAAESIVTFFSDHVNRKEIDELLSLGVNPLCEQIVVEKNHTFSGKSFVLTGSLINYTREEVSTIIKQKGGLVKNSVSKKTDYVLAGKEPGSKLSKAKTLGVRILSEKEWESLL